MTPPATAVRAGLARAGIELRHTFTSPQDLWQAFSPSLIALVAIAVTARSSMPGTDFSLGAQAMPSLVGASVAFGGLLALAATLAAEREDGTLLRAKAIPEAMVSYLLGKIIMVSGLVLIGAIVVLVPGMLIFDGLRLSGVGSWLTLLWVFCLGLAAILPIGAVAGSLLSSPRNASVIAVPLMGLIAISGIFYPITHFPTWLQAIAQSFPVYWMGLGMRSALLPAEMAAVEIGGSWRHLETVGVLGAWAIVGILVAPMILRRMARRESGSRLAARQEKAMQRGAKP